MARIYLTMTIGKKFGRLTAIEFAGIKPRGNSNARYWVFQCDCGAVRVLNIYDVIRGRATSCGCRRREGLHRTHGALARDASPGLRGAFWSYQGMVQRCTNPKHEKYPTYGGAGVKIAKRWLGRGGFERFLKDLGERPPGMTLDRKNPFKNYTPKNCRWATLEVQEINKRHNYVGGKLPEDFASRCAQMEANGW